ncbi:MAG: AsmA-like C-terminal region-containing protein, partial [Planctomycetaceae bacterium]|nr:AsmA-like C-terminal region-containing protein [Planctomycetaceae bacterium]
THTITPIVKKFFYKIWLFFCWSVLLLVVAAAVGGVYVLYQFNTTIRSYTLNELQKAFPNLDIELGKVQLDEQKGIILRKVVCYSRSSSDQFEPQQKRRPLLIVDEIYIECQISLKSLYNQKINNITRVIWRNPALRITHTSNGFLDELKNFYNINQKHTEPAPVEIQNGTLFYDDITAPQNPPVKLNDISLIILPPDSKINTQPTTTPPTPTSPNSPTPTPTPKSEPQSEPTSTSLQANDFPHEKYSSHFTANKFAHNQNAASTKESPPKKSINSSSTIQERAGTLRDLAFFKTQVTSNRQDCWRFSGQVNGDFIRQINIEGYFDPDTNQWEIAGKCRQFDWTSSLLELLPSDIQKSICCASDKDRDIKSSFQGRFDFGFSAVSAADAALGFHFAIDGVLSQGRAELHRINRTLSELNTRFKITDDGILIEKLTGLCEAARIVFSYSQQGLIKKQTAFISANIQGLAFDSKLIDGISPMLSESLRQTLCKFEHSGTADLATELFWQNEEWKPSKVQVEFAELNFMYLPAPYRLDRLQGELQINSDASMQIHLTSRSNDVLKVRIDGAYKNIFVDPIGQVQIQAEDVPIDEKFMNIIPQKERQTIKSLNPAGKINANLIITDPAGGKPLKKYLEIGLNKINVRYDKFPYPLRDITGLIRLNNDTWTFENIVGGNESARITGSGFLRPVTIVSSNESAYEFQLNVNAADLPVDGQLPDALLNEIQQDLLRNLQAKGRVNLSASISYLSQNDPSNNQFSLNFRTVPCAGFSIQPTKFPYRIDNLQGELIYNNDTVTSNRLIGMNRGTKISSGLMCRFNDDGSWVMRLDAVDIERISADRELLDALPNDLKMSIESLQIIKPVNLKGIIELSKDDDKKPLRTIWDLYVVLHQNSANLGIPAKNIFGGVRLIGYAEDDRVRLAGEMQLDSVMVNGFQINDVHGPFFYDGIPRQLYLGLPAGKILPPPPDTQQFKNFKRSAWFVGTTQGLPVTGKLFDGTIVCEGILSFANAFSYSIKTNIIGTDVGKMANELLSGSQKISGTMNCRTQIWGMGRKMETMSGSGSIELRNANIYDAPMMLRMLRELSIKPIDPKAGAFDKSDVDFEIKGNRMFFNPISFEGSLFSLTGNGEMRLDTREVNLTMKTRLGNKKTHVPIFSDVLGWAGDQIIQLNVQGTLSDPTVRRILLPATDIRNAINNE